MNRTAERLRAALLAGRRVRRFPGWDSPSVRRGSDGFEFAELREYVAGDDPRRIDWAATARAGALQTRIVLEDTAIVLAAILDDSASMSAGRRRPISAAARDALALWYGVASGADRAVRVHSDGLFEAKARGRAAALACEAFEPASEFSLNDALRAALALPRGAALLLVSDCYDPARQEFVAMLGRRLDCTLLLPRDPWRDDMPLRGFVRVRDLESNAARRLFMTRTAAHRFEAGVRAREEKLARDFEAHGWRVGEFADDGARSLLAAFAMA